MGIRTFAPLPSPPVIALPPAGPIPATDRPGPSHLLTVEGMKCGGCVRAVEQRLGQQSGVRHVSVNLLTRTAWLELANADVDLAPVLASLETLGFRARCRDQEAPLVSRRDLLQQRHWWRHWQQLLLALSLLLISGLGHLAESGALGDTRLASLLARNDLHALVATLALLGPGRSILWVGARSALAGAPGMDTLVGLGVSSAYLASLYGWLSPGSGWPCYFNEPVMLLGFVLSGRFLEERARWRTGRAIEQLAELQPDEALLIVDGGPPRPVRVGALRPGDRLRLLPGDRVPVDGVVREGCSSVDCSSLTGESLPMRVTPGSELAAGCLNQESPLDLEVLRCGADSALVRIVHMVDQAQARKAPIQGLADAVAGRFSLAVLLLAGFTFWFWWQWGCRLWPWVLTTSSGMGHGGHGGHGMADPGLSSLALALQLAIAVLVVACPCALGLATPTAITVGLGLAARSGLLFRGGDAVEAAAGLKTVLFDKTGTLTTGRPLVTAVTLSAEGAAGGFGEAAAGGADGSAAPIDRGMTADRMVQLAASLEQTSRHPLAHALLQEALRRQLPLLNPGPSEVMPGDGLVGVLDGVEGTVRVGRPEWLAGQGVTAVGRMPGDVTPNGASLLAVAVDQVLLGWIGLEDRPRGDAISTLAGLRAQGLRLGLLSGDRQGSVQRLAAEVGLGADELAWDLRPEQKLQRILLAAQAGPVAMVGDGINDAPALAAADLGVAIGTGTQMAQEAADLVILGDRLEGLPMALALSRRTMAKVRQNLFWAFGYNLLLLPIAAGLLLPFQGIRLTPPLAALLMAMSSITVVLNAVLLQAGGPSRGGIGREA